MTNRSIDLNNSHKLQKMVKPKQMPLPLVESGQELKSFRSIYERKDLHTQNNFFNATSGVAL
jgi:hypothetical protein